MLGHYFGFSGSLLTSFPHLGKTGHGGRWSVISDRNSRAGSVAGGGLWRELAGRLSLAGEGRLRRSRRGRFGGRSQANAGDVFSGCALRAPPQPAAARKALRAGFFMARLKPCPDTKARGSRRRLSRPSWVCAFPHHRDRADAGRPAVLEKGHQFSENIADAT